MNGNNSTIVTILAIIGAIVVLGWALKLFAHLIGIVIMIGLVVVAVFAVQRLMGKR